MKKQFDFTRRNNHSKNAEIVGKWIFNNADTERAELRFYGDIVSNSWQSYWYEEDKCPQDIVDFLSDLDAFQAVDIYINSGGGSVHGGLAIYNILKRYQGEKVVHVDGIAASIASVIAMAGDKIIIPRNAQLMIHKPWSYVSGNADDMRKEAEALDSCQEAILEVYMKKAKSGISREEIEELINRETWMTGADAERYFVIDVEDAAEISACTSDYFSKYQKTPKALTAAPEDFSELKDKIQTMLEFINL